MKVKMYIGENEEEVLVSCAEDGDEGELYVDKVLFKGVDISGCLEQSVLDRLIQDWSDAMRWEQEQEVRDPELDNCF